MSLAEQSAGSAAPPSAFTEIALARIAARRLASTRILLATQRRQRARAQKQVAAIRARPIFRVWMLSGEAAALAACDPTNVRLQNAACIVRGYAEAFRSYSGRRLFPWAHLQSIVARMEQCVRTGVLPESPHPSFPGCVKTTPDAIVSAS